MPIAQAIPIVQIVTEISTKAKLPLSEGFESGSFNYEISSIACQYVDANTECREMLLLVASENARGAVDGRLFTRDLSLLSL